MLPVVGWALLCSLPSELRDELFTDCRRSCEEPQIRYRVPLRIATIHYCIGVVVGIDDLIVRHSWGSPKERHLELAIGASFARHGTHQVTATFELPRVAILYAESARLKVELVVGG